MVDGRPGGAAQIGLRHWPLWGTFAILARGPVWSSDLTDANRREALRALLSDLRHSHRGVMAAPDPIGGLDPLEAPPWLPVVTPTHIAVLALDAPLETLRARQTAKWRNRLKRAEAVDLTIAAGPMPADADHWLLGKEQEQRRARGYRGSSPAYTMGWLMGGGRKSARLFTASLGGEIIAAMLFLLHPPGASYHIGWCSAAGRTANAHPLLLWNAITWLAGKGYAEIDLDVIDTENEPGLARFKLGAGAKPVPISATRLLAPGTGLVSRLTRQAA